MKFVLCVYFAFASGTVFAQTTGAISPTPTQQPSINEEVPLGGCMPLGVTASGEIVFPFQCKEFIEKHRGKDPEPPTAAEQAPSVVVAKPAAIGPKADAVDERPNLEKSEAAPLTNSEPSAKQAGTVSRNIDRHAGRAGAEGCQRFRTYDPNSASYRGYDGKRRSCR